MLEEQDQEEKTGVYFLQKAPKKNEKITRRKKVKFNRSATALKRMSKNKRKQSGKGLGEYLAKIGLGLGLKH